LPGSLGWGIFDGPTDLPSAQAIASWHANAVRVPLNEDCWLGINGVNPAYGGAAYQAAIEAYVATLHQAGLYVIVDLHWNAPGSVPAASQQPLPDADHAVDFWTSVASAFASDPAVVLDLYNEPFLYGSYLQDPSQDPWACWLNGCTLNQYLTGGTPYTLPLVWNTAGMQPLVNAVRATGAKNPIMVGGLDWANDLSVPWADSMGISYLGWTWNTWGDCNNVLIADYTGTPTANYGVAFQTRLLASHP
jgi:aryl-phospho-beta-D-glucosidase BglC (GH1 family)